MDAEEKEIEKKERELNSHLSKELATIEKDRAIIDESKKEVVALKDGLKFQN